MHDVTPLDCSRIAQDLQIRKVQVESVVGLLHEGNTVAFIARYRKERTSGLGEDIIRHIQVRLNLLRQLGERKQTILKSIDGQGKLSDDLRQAILAADTHKRLDDLYLPYKPKSKKTPAALARERGLEPLALAVWQRDAAVPNLEELLPTLVNLEKQLGTPADVQAGVQHILAELVGEIAEVRAAVRSVLWETGKVCSSKSDKVPEGQGQEYKDYFQFTESARQIPPHRILALNRGEKEGALKVRLEWHGEAVQQTALTAVAEHALREAERAAPAGQDNPQPLSATHGARAEAAAIASDGAIGEPVLGEPVLGTATVPSADPAPPLTESAPEEPGETAPLAAPGTSAPGTSAPGTSATTGTVAMATAVASPPLPVVARLPADVGEPLTPHVPYRTPHAAFLRAVVEDALQRLLLPALEREIRHELTEEAEAHAVSVLARNLRSLLLQPPLRNKRVLAIDPGFRGGCRVAVLDEHGNLLEDATVHPHARKPRERPGKSAAPEATKPAPAAAPAAAPAIAAATETPPVPPPETTAAPLAPPSSPRLTLPVGPVIVSAFVPIEASAATPAPAADKPDRREEAKTKLRDLVTRHHVQVLALGNGPGSRETEEFLAELISSSLPELAYVVVNEAGAREYSGSAVAREEFPHVDGAARGTISIGRRLQDPLSELVKIDPQHIGVGLYQHDVRRRDLRESLEAVVSSSVNQVGVDINTASVSLLRYVSGLNSLVGREIVDYRKQHGPFKNREQLLQLPGLGPVRFQQAAGFLNVVGGDNPLDRTWIHPESYGLAQKLLAEIGCTPTVLDEPNIDDLRGKLRGVNPHDMASRLGAGVPTVHDLVDALAHPDYDPRDDLQPPILKKGILKLDDLQPGMELKGTVLNVVDFGAFVDIGLRDSGLVHISQMANRYIKSPYDVVAVNDVVTVWVLTVDRERHRVSLTMIRPGTERRQGERRESRPRAAQQGRPPRGRRPEEQAPAGQSGERPPPRGRHGRPPRPQPAPAGDHAAAATSGSPAPAEAAPQSKPPPPPPRPAPRRPRREAPRPKLSQAALEGKVPLRTFGELSALFAAKQRPPEPPPRPPEPVREPEPVQAISEPAAAVAEPATAPSADPGSNT